MLLVLSAAAQVVPTGPFAGEFSEGFEAFPFTTAALPCLAGAFGGQGDVCAPDANVGGMQVRDELFLGACLLSPQGGTKLAGSNDGAVEITFDTPLRKFGGRFSTHAATAANVVIELYGPDGTELASFSEPVGQCTWGWRGYEVAGGPGIARVRVRHTLNGGALADLDGMAIETLCGPSAVDADGDGAPACYDCDDNAANVRPGALDLCNGVDDDCNGTVDDGPESPPEGTVQDGVCAGSLQICSDGAWIDPDYTTLAGYELAEATCDGLDNDCNGAVDDGLTPPGVGPAFGVCLALEATCDGTAGWSSPEAVDWPTLVPYEAEETTCDGLDNDCDGGIDAALEAPLAANQQGECAGSLQVCAGTEGWAEPPTPDATEICDELDNDCDGEVDEDCVRVGPKCATVPRSLTVLGARRR